MRVLYFYQYFSTPKGAWGTRAYEFARHWVDRGATVTVVTSVYDKSDLQPEGLVSRFAVEGIDVVVINTRLSNKHGLLMRLMTFVAYALIASWYALRIPADVVVASSGPITVGLPALVARYVRRLPVVFEIRDLLPEVAEAMGLLTNRLARLGSYWFIRRCYRAATTVVALSDGMAAHVRERYGVKDVVSIPNMADNDLFGAADAADHETELPYWAVTNDLVLFTGTMGAANYCEFIVAGAAYLAASSEDPPHFVFIGDGKERPKLEAEVEAAGLPNVHFLDPMPKEQLPKWLHQAFCSILTLRPIPILDTSSPNKLFDSLAAGLPVVQTTQGWIKDLLEEEQCGFTVRGGDVQGLEAAITKLRSRPELQRRMAENAGRAARTRFDQRLLAAKMDRVVTETAARQL